MHDALMLLAALLANLAGMGWLALAMEAHWRQVHAGAPPRRATVHGLRLLGATALLGSLALCIAVDHPSMAVLVWVMALAAAALATAFMLSWRPHWLRWLCPRRTATGEHGDGSSGR